MQGECPEEVLIILSGLGCRHKLLEEGERQIVAFLVPGDICDLHIALLGAMDHTISTDQHEEQRLDQDERARPGFSIPASVTRRPSGGWPVLCCNLRPWAARRDNMGSSGTTPG